MTDDWFRSRGMHFVFGALVLIGTLGVLAIIYLLSIRYTRPAPSLTIIPTCYQNLQDKDIIALIDRVSKRMDADLLDWRNDRILNRTVYFILVGGAALLSLLASILTAIRERSGEKTSIKDWQRYTLIAIPAFSAAFLTAASHFHISEILQSRIDGLSTIESLQRELLFSKCTQENVSKVDQSLIDLEHHQESTISGR